jgi:hypothetical protein
LFETQIVILRGDAAQFGIGALMGRVVVEVVLPNLAPMRGSMMTKAERNEIAGLIPAAFADRDNVMDFEIVFITANTASVVISCEDQCANACKPYANLSDAV